MTFCIDSVLSRVTPKLFTESERGMMNVECVCIILLFPLIVCCFDSLFLG